MARSVAQARRLQERFIGTLIITVHTETDLGDVIDLLIEHRIGAIPVVHPDSSKLLGIVSYIDVLRVARESL